MNAKQDKTVESAVKAIKSVMACPTARLGESQVFRHMERMGVSRRSFLAVMKNEITRAEIEARTGVIIEYFCSDCVRHPPRSGYADFTKTAARVEISILDR